MNTWDDERIVMSVGDCKEGCKNLPQARWSRSSNGKTDMNDDHFSCRAYDSDQATRNNIVKFEVEFSHIGDVAYVQFASNTNGRPLDETWGIQDFKLTTFGG